MSSSVLQIQVDDKLKEDVTAVYNQLGLDLSTAVRIFFKRSVAEQGIPFSMRLPPDTQKDVTRKKIPPSVLEAMDAMSDSAAKNTVSGMSLEEINAEIQAARQGR